jgi:hypothetical protein
MKLFCEKDYEMVQTEMDEFAKATNKGSNQKKVRELGAEIKKRLAALPLPTASLSGLANTAATPMATAAASPTAAPQPK